MKLIIKKSLFLISILFLLFDISQAQEIQCKKDEFKVSGYCWVLLEDIEIDTGKVTEVHGSLNAFYNESGDITDKTKLKFAITFWHTNKKWHWKYSEKIYFLVDDKRIIREKIKSTSNYSFPISFENIKEISQAEEVRFKIANSEMRLSQKHKEAIRKFLEKIENDDFFSENN